MSQISTPFPGGENGKLQNFASNTSSKFPLQISSVHIEKDGVWSGKTYSNI